MTTKEELFEQHKNIVYYCYSKLYKDEFIEKSKEDLVQEGFLALWQACRLYNEELNIKLSTYAFTTIRNTMIRWIKVNRSYYYNNIGLDAPPKDAEDDDISLAEAIPDINVLETIETTVAELLKKYREWLINTRVNSNQTYINNRLYRANIILNELVARERIHTREIESEYGINRTTVSKIFKELRECLKDDYPTRFKNGERKNGTNSECE